MLPHEHLISGIIVAGILFLIYPIIGFLGVLLIVLSAVLVDVDHYLFYVIKKKDLNLVNAYKWYEFNRKRTHYLSKKEKNKIFFGFHFLHGIEIFAIIYLLYAYVNPIFLYIMIGYSLHFFADLLVEAIWCGKTDKISVIYSFIRMNKLKFVDDI